MTDIETIRNHQRAFLDQIKSRKGPAVYTVEGVEIKVNPGVFPPATDTRLLASHIKTKPGERTLDLTTGAGVFSVIAGLQGATGIAVDINPVAVENARENFSKRNVQIRAIQSNLFESVPEEQFDQIFANGPFFEGEIIDPLDYACYGAKAFIEGLFSGIRSKLKTNGRLLIVMSAWSGLQYFEDTIKRNNLLSTLTATRSSDDRERKYNLYEVKVTKT